MDIVIGIIFISLIGTLLHFMYEWSGHNKVVSLFAAVNESTWEHIKIALTPTFIWTLYDGAVYGLNQNYFIAKTASLLVIILLVIDILLIFAPGITSEDYGEKTFYIRCRDIGR